MIELKFREYFLSASFGSNHYLSAYNSHQSRIHQVHARISSNTVEASRRLEDGVSTKICISHQPTSHKERQPVNKLPDSGSPPFADATDTDENSEECEERIHGRIQTTKPPNHCSNQRRKRYCSLDCYKAAESNTRYVYSIGIPFKIMTMYNTF